VALIQKQQIKLYNCGCGKEAKPGKRFIYGHNRNKDFLPSEDARKVVRSLGVKNGLKYG
jgi:hypothetical protein